MTNEQLLEALTIGRDCAAEVANSYHEAMKGYRQHRHDALDADVATIEAAISALATQPQAPQGWIPVEDGLPTCNPEPNSFGSPVLVYPPFDDGVSRAHNEAFYGCRQTDEPNFYLFGRVFYPKFWQYPPAAPTKTPEVLE